MLSATKRIKLALVLLPALLVPACWFIAAFSALNLGPKGYDLLILLLQGAASAFVAAYSITSFIDFMRVLRDGQKDPAQPR